MTRLLAKLSRVKPSGARQWMARCPAHEDGTASLSIKEGNDGRVLLNCHAMCQTATVVAAIGLSMSDLYAQPLTKSAPTSVTPVERPALVKTYDYVNADGELQFQACRFRKADGKKEFRQRRPDGKGGWIWNLGDVEPVLYRLPETLAAIESGKTIYVVEGEKDADALSAEGYPATTCPMGAGKWRETFSASLKGAAVVIFPDNDEPGQSHAEQVAASLTAADCAVKVVMLPNLPPKGDVSDWLDSPDCDVDVMEDLVASTPRWTADAMQAKHRTRWRLDELMENESIMRPPPAIVSRIAWAGRSTLLAAREKAGKSTLTGFMTACVSNGDPFLGVFCPKGPVLVIGLEEFIGDTARRLKEFGAAPKNVYLVDRFAGELRADELQAHIEAVSPLLVIIDSLATWSNGVGITDHNDAAAMTGVLQPLTDMVHRHGAALVIIHHTTKGDGKARGSTAITAGVDMVCTFTIPEPETDPTLRRVESVGRLPVPRLYDIRFNGDTYELAQSLVAPIDERIIAVVAERPLISAGDVADAVQGRKTDVLTRIDALCATGRLRNLSTNTHTRRLVTPDHPLNPTLL